jgi:hypothetical protein
MFFCPNIHLSQNRLRYLQHRFARLKSEKIGLLTKAVMYYGHVRPKKVFSNLNYFNFLDISCEKRLVFSLHKKFDTDVKALHSI